MAPKEKRTCHVQETEIARMVEAVLIEGGMAWPTILW